MRIDAINRGYDIYSKQVSATSKANGKVNSKDEVDLSSQAKDFATIKKMLAKETDVREELVQDIKQRIDNGTYNVSSKDVADKILSLNHYEK